MPRQARLDAPGVMHHVMSRGIERRNIVRDAGDREDVLARLARRLPETQAACYAWVRMPNPVHWLLRPSSAPVPTVMRRRLTGDAVQFTHRHKRHGLVFQNRYQAVVCQEELDFAERVRASHLNPLRAGIMADGRELNRYPYGGDSTVVGRSRRPWPATQDVLTSFGKTVAQARKAYGDVAAGVPPGRRDDRIGGGLIRTLGGWAAGADRREAGYARRKSDERIVGEAEWVEAIVKPATEHDTRQTAWTRSSVGFEHRVARVAEIFRVEPHDVVAQGRQRRRVDARSLLGFGAVRELGVSLAEMARNLGMSPPGVGYAVQRGEAMVRRNRYELGR